MDDSLLLRYNRQIMMSEIDITGQQKIIDSTVAIVGMGGLGSPIAMYLAASGVGHLILNDFDLVDLSNLQRQILFKSEEVDESKVFAAERTLNALNPEVRVTTINKVLKDSEIAEVVKKADVVVDATDNFDIRFALNQACVKMKTPLVSGAAIRMEGQMIVYRPEKEDSPCFRCLYRPEDEPEERCSETGVLGSLCGTIGSMQATEVIKILTDIDDNQYGMLVLYDAARSEWQQIRVPKDKHCPVCSTIKSKV